MADFMSDGDRKLYDSLLRGFRYNQMVYHDYFNKIIRSSIVNLIQARGLSIANEEGSDEKILRRFDEASHISRKNNFFELNLKDKNNSPAKLIYYFPEIIAGNGRVFLSEPGNKRITEFTQFEKIDESVPVINGRGPFGAPTDYYTRNFGARITTIISGEEGLIVNDLNIVNTLKEIEYPMASVGESVTNIRLYPPVDAEISDFETPVVQAKDTSEGAVRTKSVSIVSKISGALKKQYRNPIDGKIHRFKDIKETYEIPDYGKSEKTPRDLDYIRNLVEENEALVNDFVKKHSKEESIQGINESSVPPLARIGTPLIQREGIEAIDEKPEPPVVGNIEPLIQKEEIKMPSLLMPAVENKLFLLLVDKIAKHIDMTTRSAGRIGVLSKTLFEVLKINRLHLKLVDGVPPIKVIEDIKLSDGNFEFIDQEGSTYKLRLGGSSGSLMSLISDDKAINVSHVYYGGEHPSFSDFEGFRITTIGAKEGDVYRNETDICFSRESTSKRVIPEFVTINPKTELCNKGLLLSLGLDSKDVLKEAFEKIRLGHQEEIFESIHRFGLNLTDFDNPKLSYTRDKFLLGVNGNPGDENEFNASYIEQAIRLNAEALDEFLSGSNVKRL